MPTKVNRADWCRHHNSVRSHGTLPRLRLPKRIARAGQDEEAGCAHAAAVTVFHAVALAGGAPRATRASPAGRRIACWPSHRLLAVASPAGRRAFCPDRKHDAICGGRQIWKSCAECKLVRKFVADRQITDPSKTVVLC